MAGEDDQLTIDELAQRTGMTVRNVRAHQSRGLLPPPEVRGRTGYYRSDHVARIELIKELQADGYNLELIGRLVDTAGGASNEVLTFTRAVRAPFGDEEPRIVEASELAENWNSSDPALLDRAVSLGLLSDLGDGRYEELSPRLARAGAELGQLGIPAEAALEVVAKLRKQAESVARTFIALFIEEVWQPFEAADRPEERFGEVQEALTRLRPLAAESLLAVFGLVMNEAVDRAFGRELARLGDEARRDKPKGKRRRSRARMRTNKRTIK